jgi:class 3 adenylate cyclase
MPPVSPVTAHGSRDVRGLSFCGEEILVVLGGSSSPGDLLRSSLEERDAEPRVSGGLGVPGNSDAAAPETPPICPTCGAPVPEGFSFCGQCGRGLAATFRPPPEGTITILFTDIEGSTALTHDLGNEAALQIMHDHNSIVRTCIQRNSGFEVKTQGDGFMVAFASAGGAILCAVDIQRSMAEYNHQRPQSNILVRIGVNSGDTLRHDEDLFGVAVNLAARIATRAHGGQILVSGLVRGLAGPMPGITYVPRGRIEARGFAYRFRLYEVQWEA